MFLSLIGAKIYSLLQTLAVPATPNKKSVSDLRKWFKEVFEESFCQTIRFSSA